MGNAAKGWAGCGIVVHLSHPPTSLPLSRSPRRPRPLAAPPLPQARTTDPRAPYALSYIFM